MSLGDAFPKDFREDHARRILKVGSVLRMFVKDTNPPKEKRFIIVGFSEDRVSLASVFINSEINLLVNYSQEVRELHLFLSSDGREYLKHDSYVDCSQLASRAVSDIFESLINRPEACIGEVGRDDMLAIRKTIAGAATIKGKLKKKYSLFDIPG